MGVWVILTPCRFQSFLILYKMCYTRRQPTKQREAEYCLHMDVYVCKVLTAPVNCLFFFHCAATLCVCAFQVWLIHSLSERASYRQGAYLHLLGYLTSIWLIKNVNRVLRYRTETFRHPWLLKCGTKQKNVGQLPDQCVVYVT